MGSGVRVLDRAFRIIELLAKAERPLTLSEIARQTGLSKTTAHRLLQSMYAHRCIERTEDQCYIIGHKLIEMVSYRIAHLELQTEAKPFLSALRSELNLTTHLGVLDAHEVVYVEKMDQYPSMRLYYRVGYRSPAYCSSMGKCLLAGLSGAELEEAMQDCVFERFTANTISSLTELKRHLRAVRKNGWALDDEEHLVNHRCVGAPIYDYRGETVASISVSGSRAELSDYKLPFVIAQVREAASQISKRMGYSG